jgi:hypothetical protein
LLVGFVVVVVVFVCIPQQTGWNLRVLPVDAMDAQTINYSATCIFLYVFSMKSHLS